MEGTNPEFMISIRSYVLTDICMARSSNKWGTWNNSSIELNKLWIVRKIQRMGYGLVICIELWNTRMDNIEMSIPASTEKIYLSFETVLASIRI